MPNVAVVIGLLLMVRSSRPLRARAAGSPRAGASSADSRSASPVGFGGRAGPSRQQPELVADELGFDGAAEELFGKRIGGQPRDDRAHDLGRRAQLPNPNCDRVERAALGRDHAGCTLKHRMPWSPYSAFRKPATRWNAPFERRSSCPSRRRPPASVGSA